MCKNKLTLEIEVDTQFGPVDATNIIRTALNFPSVTSIVLTNLETTYKLLAPQDAQQHMMKDFPHKLK